MTRGDIEIYDDGKGRPASDLCRLPPEASQRAASQVATMVDAARGDWATYLDFTDVVSLEAVHAFDSHWTRQLRIPLIVNAGSGIVNSDSTDRDHAVGAKRR
jgi:hypothetical protein